RAGDVEQEHEPARAADALPAAAVDRLAAGAEGPAQRPPQVRRAARRRPPPARAPWRQDERQLRHQLRDPGELLRRAAREALRPQHLDATRGRELDLLDEDAA